MKKIFITTMGLALFASSNLKAADIQEMSTAEAKLRVQALVQQLSAETNEETRGYLNELINASNAILDNTKQPVGALAIMAGVDAGIQFKTFKMGEKNLLLGPGFQAIFGPLFTVFKDASSGKRGLDIRTASLVGFNLTAKRSKDFFEPSFQSQVGLVFVFPHKKKNGLSKNKRVLDLGGDYIGVAGEGAFPVFLLNRIRLNVGIYSKPDFDALVDESGTSLAKIARDEIKDSKMILASKKNFSDKFSSLWDKSKKAGSDSLASIGTTVGSFVENVIEGDSTMLVLNLQGGTKDAPLEAQLEGLRLNINP